MLVALLELFTGQTVWNIICFNVFLCLQSAVSSNCFVSGPVFDRSAVRATQAGWLLASLSSCRHPLPLWHLLGWVPPTSPSERFVVLRHHQCHSPLGSLMHLKFKKQSQSLPFQYISRVFYQQLQQLLIVNEPDIYNINLSEGRSQCPAAYLCRCWHSSSELHLPPGPPGSPGIVWRQKSELKENLRDTAL